MYERHPPLISSLHRYLIHMGEAKPLVIRILGDVGAQSNLITTRTSSDPRCSTLSVIGFMVLIIDLTEVIYLRSLPGGSH